MAKKDQPNNRSEDLIEVINEEDTDQIEGSALDITPDEIKKLSLLEKLSIIRDKIDGVKKNKKGFNYTYADLFSILPAVKHWMSKLGVMLIPRLGEGVSSEPIDYVKSRPSKNGDTLEEKCHEYLITSKMEYLWINIDDPLDIYSVPWFLCGVQQDVSQAFGSALTYTERYFLINFFQLPVADDVEAITSAKKEIEEKEKSKILDELITVIDTKVRSYLSVHPEKSEEVKLFMAKYDKNSDFRKIKEISLAKSLIDNFTKIFKPEEENEQQDK